MYDAYFEYREGELYATTTRREAKVGKKIGCPNNVGYTQLSFKGKTTLAHRVIWIMHNGPIPDGYEIDHINRVRNDNRIENLRLLTVAENRSRQHKSGNYTKQPTVECPHCSKVGQKSIMMRWHFDNCKERKWLQ